MLKPDAALRKDRTTVPTLEHRHFAFIATTLAELKPDSTWLAECDQWRGLVRAFADACARANPRFDRARFLRACNVEG